MSDGLKLKEIADVFGGSDQDKYRRHRALGRIATGISRVDSPSLFRPEGSMFGHKTAAKLYDQYAVAWAAVFFYLTEVLELDEVTAKSEAMPSMESIKVAFEGVAKGENWELIVESEAYWDTDEKQFRSQIQISGAPFVTRCSEHPAALLTKSMVSLNPIFAPLGILIVKGAAT